MQEMHSPQTSPDSPLFRVQPLHTQDGPSLSYPFLQALDLIAYACCEAEVVFVTYFSFAFLSFTNSSLCSYMIVLFFFFFIEIMNVGLDIGK